MLFMYAAMIDDEVDQLRFADIYHGYRKQMLLVAKRVLNNDEDAEDAVQIAFLGIAQRIKSVPSDDPKKLRAYVLTAAKKRHSRRQQMNVLVVEPGLPLCKMPKGNVR